MTKNLAKPLAFVFILGLLSCTNNAPDQKEAAVDPNEGTPVLVANDKAADEAKEQPIEEKQPTKPSTQATVNQKPKSEPEPEPKPQEKNKVEQETAAPIKKEAIIQLVEEKTTVNSPKNESAKTVGVSHEAWDALLKKYVNSSGVVNYKGFKANAGELDAYLDHLAKNPVKTDWSRAEQMAYWINAYNAFTIKLIVDNYPVSSITKLHGGKPWDVKWIKLGNQTYSLNNIEHDILRPKFNDARIHFAVNCAAQSCPPLLNQAWRSSTLDKTFDQQARKFINNSKFNKISSNEIQISKIFEWYASDFGNLIDYLNQYSDTKIKPNAKVTYLEYDWALNN